MNKLNYLILLPLVMVTGCAQVPPEAVELSVTVGRDMAEMKRSHVALVNIHYKQLLSKINRFVDEVYLPYQVQKTLEFAPVKRELLNSINAASRPDTTGKSQREAMEKIELFLVTIQREVNSYRVLKTEPVIKERDELLKNINESYERIHYANSIVTGHLASVRKVHDSQSELLKKIEMGDLREKIAVNAPKNSEAIDQLIESTKSISSAKKLKDAVARFDQLVFKNR
ncbi:MAG: hypothetical protein OQK78_08645 [Gammaproteobacteria bacterium]|nr:hypothetical protein [Gammaproteobacteria bacterium]